MICPNCSASNEAGRKFCLDCGQPLTSTCSSCGTLNTPGAKFCGECGTTLAIANAGQPSGQGVSSQPATERRFVSVLFADLVGFTTLSEARDAEDVQELLSHYFETSRQIVERYGGSVEKFIGDAVMAVWGTPAVQEDDAERAVRAALDLVDAVRRIGGERGVPELALRAGVLSGEAVVTIGASGMGMVAGDLVNTAARLQSVAAPGAVLVGEETRRAASEAIVFEQAGEQALRGKTTPVPAYRAVRVVAQRGGVGRAGGLEPPFVGRDAELQLIKDFYHATGRERGPRLVSVIGQAGIGKSRLAWEFLKYIDGVTEIVHWHQGRSPAYGDGISFWALGEMVRMRLGINESADQGTTRARLAETLEAFVPHLDERRSLEEPILHLLGMGDGTPRDRSQLFLAWRTFFERIADVGPVVMVFEDLQWADDGMLDFIEELLTWSRGHSLYLITLARPELLDRRSTWGAGQRSFTSLNLSPLSSDEMRQLLDGLVPGLTDRTIGQIVERAEGIPLYAVEMVRSLLDDGRIERDGDTFRPVGELGDVDVPPSLHGLIAARIDALPVPQRMLLQDGAVLGDSFTLSAVQAVTRANPADVEQLLARLVQRELLTVEDDARSPERGQYRFLQGLLREVAYGTLSRDDRRARHLAAARYYEALGDDELSGMLAQHYVDAYEAHPDGPEGAAVATQARVALRGAAQRASDLGSFRLAHGYLESALRVVTDAAEELDLRGAARVAAARAGMFDVAVANGRREVELAEQLGDRVARRLAVAELADILMEGQQQQAHQLLTDALDEPGLQPGDPGYPFLAVVLAKLEMRMQNDARAVELADAALPSLAETGDDGLVIEMLNTRGVALANLRRQAEGVVILTGALEVARRRGLSDSAGRAAINLAYILNADDPAAAFAVSRDQADEALKTGVVWGIRYLLGNAVDAAIEVGEWDWAVAATSDKDFLGDEPAEQLWFGAFLGVIAAFRGEDVDARAAALYDQARDADDPQYRVLSRLLLLITGLLRNDTDSVVRVADESLAIGTAGVDAAVHGARAATWAGDVKTAVRMRAAFDEHRRSGRRTEALMAVIDGGIAALEGRDAEARASFVAAQRTLRDLGLALWLGLCDLDIVMTRALDPDGRRQAAEEAREIFTQLGADALLEHLDRALSGDDASPPPPPVVGSGMPEEAAQRTRSEPIGG